MRRKILDMRLWLALILGSLLAFGEPVASSDQESDLVDRLGAIEHEHQAVCPALDTRNRLQTRIGLLIDEMRSTGGVPVASTEGVAALDRLVFDRLAIKASQDLEDPCNLLPSGVLERKQGYCVGIAALYLALAERMNLPIYAVATPSHLFLRYDDGRTRLNIEMLQNGASISDEQYVRDERIPEASIRRGIFMRNLTTEKFLAQVHNDLGVFYSKAQNYAAAAREYELALEMDRRMPAAFYNYGNDLLKTSKIRRAIRMYSNALRLYPRDVYALNNRGLAYLEAGKLRKARRDFDEALQIDPGFEQARRNLDRLGKRAVDPDSARARY